MLRSLQSLAAWPRRAKSAALDLLLPPRCVACDADLLGGRGPAMLCCDCQRRLPLIEWPVCPHCAAAVPVAQHRSLPCNYCNHARLRFDRTVALGSNEDLLRELVIRMKSDRSGGVARMFIGLAWARLGASLTALGVDVVTCVPDRPAARRRRGASAAGELAAQAARRLKRPFAERMLGLAGEVAPQVGLSRAGRFENISRKMHVRPGHRLDAAHVLLVDDILTTGATCGEAARALKQAGAAAVSVFVVGRTPSDQLPMHAS